MNRPLHFLVIDGYPQESRDAFDVVGMKLSWKLYAEMLKSHLPEASFSVWLPSDIAAPPGELGPEHYQGVLWTGCNLTIYDDDPRVHRQIDFARRAYSVGTPSFGSCWGLQMAVVAAGGEVKANPRGREIGIARKIGLTAAGLEHPMMEGKPRVYDGFISHLDEVTRLPRDAMHLATNDFTSIQALEVRHQRGIFWATQYHPEYDLATMARLMVARRERLLEEGFYAGGDSFLAHLTDVETLAAEPKRKDLRWRLAIDDDVLDPIVRQQEFANWIRRVVLPGARA